MFNEEEEQPSQTIRHDGPQLGARNDEPQLAKAAEPQGEMRGQIMEYYHINQTHYDIIHRLKRLAERLQGDNPEKSQVVERPEPPGLIAAMNQLNNNHTEDLENMSNLVSILERSI